MRTPSVLTTATLYVAGGVLFVALSRAAAPPADKALVEPVVVTATMLARAHRTALLTSPPGLSREDATRAAVQAEIDDELLLREALSLGLDRHDAVVVRRLIANMRYFGEPGDDAELLARARALGLHRSDQVVRRRLIERLRQAAQAAARREQLDSGDRPLSIDEAERRGRAEFARRLARLRSQAQVRWPVPADTPDELGHRDSE